MRRVAILGGGMAGLSAAWALSGQEDVDVTVYQRGWRLGGKGASSRGAHGRIEEHGLHVWLGYYDNSFRLLQDVYAELDRAATDPRCPITTWQDAVAPSDHVGVGDLSHGSWAHWLAAFSRNDLVPGSAPEGAAPLSVATFVQRGLGLLLDFAASLGPVTPQPAGVVLSGSPRRPRPPAGPAAGIGGLLGQAETALTVGLAQAMRILGDVSGLASCAFGSLASASLNQVRTDLDARLRRDSAGRRTAQLADLVVTCIEGIVKDGLLAERAGFATVDHLDFRDWLARHGARSDTLGSPLIRGMYDLVFAYEQGDVTRPRFSAGWGLFLAGKLFFDYRGAIFWQMRAGMGDVVIAPLYQALRARGVRFKFFHRLDGVHLDPGGTRVATITLGRQARTREGREYEPLVRVGGLPCFPDRPLSEQLMGTAPADLESHWSDRAREEPVRLRAGVDFDDVVLATSVGMLPFVCGELIDRSPRWQAMVRGLATVPTQALQVWLRADELELGWPQPGSTVSGYVAPFDTYASMSHLAAREDWPDTDRPRAIGYFCSVLPTAAAHDPARAHETVRSTAIAFLDEHARHLWPGAVEPDGGFRWSLLCGAPQTADATAIDSQYWRANVDPSDRYVQCMPGSNALRLRADASGVDNLVLAGDWIDCGLNAGCIESAVMGGLQAANAVRRVPLTQGIRGAWAGPQAS